MSESVDELLGPPNECTLRGEEARAVAVHDALDVLLIIHCHHCRRRRRRVVVVVVIIVKKILVQMVRLVGFFHRSKGSATRATRVCVARQGTDLREHQGHRRVAVLRYCTRVRAIRRPGPSATGAPPPSRHEEIGIGDTASIVGLYRRMTDRYRRLTGKRSLVPDPKEVLAEYEPPISRHPYRRLSH